MQNLSDNELDKHFQEAAEKYRPPFDPAAWNAMQRRLSETDGTDTTGWAGFQRGLPFILIFLAGSITGVLTWSYFTTPTNSGDTSLPLTTPLQSIADPSVSKDISSLDITNNEDTADQNREVNRASKTITDAGLISKQKQSPGSHPNQETPISNAQHRRNNQTLTVPGLRNPEKTNIIQVAPNQTPATVSPDPAGAPVRSLSAHTPPGHNTAEDKINVVISETADSVKAQDQAITRQPESKADDLSNEKPQRAAPTYRLSLIGALSPDFSSVNFGKQSRPGINFAGLIEFHITSKFSVMSGLISSTKLYKARDVEYYGHAYPEAEGDCRIIDIPLNIYYRSAGTSRYSWFAGAGISSYIMKKENYVFYYDSPYGKASYDKEVRNKNNEWFKVLNVSAGVSRKIGPRFFIEAEPFVKIPLGGVGDGNLDLSTAGMFVRARYSLLKTH